MAAPQLRRLTRFIQPLPRELPHRLQHAIARLERLGLERDEGLVYETAQQVEHVDGGNRPSRSPRYRLRRVEREPSGEHRQSPEQDPLRFSEQ